jgi:hypothetical protein
MYYTAEEYLAQLTEDLQDGDHKLSDEMKRDTKSKIEDVKKKLAKLSSGKGITDRFFGYGILLFTDIPPPTSRRKKGTNSASNQSAEFAGEQRESSSHEEANEYKKQSITPKDPWNEWEEVLDRISVFEKNRFALAFESTNYILKTLGSFNLAPLLAILAWLLLSVGGATDYRTFAIISFAIGLATKTIIKRVMSFVGEQFKEDEENVSKRTEPRAISTDPAQAKAGQILTVTGKGFSTDSIVSLYYGDNGVDKLIVKSLPTSTSGTFVYEFRSLNLPPNTYTLTAKDRDGSNVSTNLLTT